MTTTESDARHSALANVLEANADVVDVERVDEAGEPPASEIVVDGAVVPPTVVRSIGSLDLAIADASVQGVTTDTPSMVVAVR